MTSCDSRLRFCSPLIDSQPNLTMHLSTKQSHRRRPGPGPQPMPQEKAGGLVGGLLGDLLGGFIDVLILAVGGAFTEPPVDLALKLDVVKGALAPAPVELGLLVQQPVRDPQRDPHHPPDPRAERDRDRRCDHHRGQADCFGLNRTRRVLINIRDDGA